MKGLLKTLKSLWFPAREVWLVRSLVVLMLGGAVLWGAGSYFFYQKLSGNLELSSLSESDEVAYDTSSRVELGGSHIPEDIIERQDGDEESGHDLRELKFDHERGVAAILEKDGIEVSLGNYFETVDNVIAGLKQVGSNDIQGIAEVEVSFEIDSRFAKDEVEIRQVEFRSTMASILSEFSKEELLSVEGKLKAKKKIMSEINFRMREGNVVDVLFTGFRVR